MWSKGGSSPPEQRSQERAEGLAFQERISEKEQLPLSQFKIAVIIF
jgi:hypothetical protein